MYLAKLRYYSRFQYSQLSRVVWKVFSQYAFSTGIRFQYSQLSRVVWKAMCFRAYRPMCDVSVLSVESSGLEAY